jgi:hypothetical protein
MIKELTKGKDRSDKLIKQRDSKIEEPKVEHERAIRKVAEGSAEIGRLKGHGRRRVTDLSSIEPVRRMGCGAEGAVFCMRPGRRCKNCG